MRLGINWGATAAIIFSILYFIFLWPFYSARWYVPDFFLYHSFAQNGIIARDGFSSLFVLIASLPLKYALSLHIASLACMAISLGMFLYFSYCIVETKYHRLLAFGAILSCGIWYYFYGKQFYDLPFSMLCLSLLLYFILKSDKHRWAAAAVWVCVGFFLSWKPYNIFAAGGLGLLLLFHPHYSHCIFGLHIRRLGDFSMLFAKEKIPQICRWILLMMLGYFAGNFSIFIHPLKTIKGILAYSAHYNFMKHLFSHMLIWDHVNSVAIHLGVFFVPSACIILLFLPLLLKNKLFLMLSLFFTLIYALFIIFKSPGYIWHSFMFAVFLLFFFIFSLHEAEIFAPESRLCLRILASVAIILQCLNNFILYLPKEIFWFRQTQNVIAMAQEHSDEIYTNVQKMTQNLDGPFIVHVGLQRYTVKENYKAAAIDKDYQDLQGHVRAGEKAKYGLLICFPALHQPGMKEIREASLGSSHLIWEDYSLIQTKDYGLYQIQIFKIRD